MSDVQPNQEAIYTAVADRYSRIAQGQDSSCCTPNTKADVLFSDIYTTDTSHLPADITNLSLGCGDPITLAALEPGQVVLDLGSGGGIDCFLAAERVGATGHVIGVDMTPAMLAKAEANKAKLGVTNVDFRQGQIEALPVEDTAVDVIISNCVVNLSPNKAQVFREAYSLPARLYFVTISVIVPLLPNSPPGPTTPYPPPNTSA
ncbi:MAG: methyltransferase domain-containing protein, partial [Anaerolineales bacterium]|nr:methyltransferase domain-containing protein [Anaerolineales bacterium]